jgi:prepilin-type processing-associated H-X9-DG protein
LNNLRQIGIALENYHASHDVYPPGYLSSPVSNSPGSIESGPGWGWAAFLLNFAEQRPVYNAINFSIAISSSPSQTARSTYLSLYLCPSSSNSEPVSMRPIGTNISLDDVAASQYVGSAGLLDPEEFPETNNGTFFRQSHLGHRDLIDGLSSTILIGERSRNVADATWVGAVPGCILCTNPTWQSHNSSCEEASAMTLGYSEPRKSLLSSTVPNATSAGAGNFWSWHTSGCNFLFGDGSVKFIKDSINDRVFASIITRACGEVVLDDF